MQHEGCSRSITPRAQEVVTRVQSPSSSSIQCHVLEGDAQPEGEWQAIMSSNGPQTVRYTFGAISTTTNYNESDSQSSASWSVGITAYFLKLGVNGGSGLSNLNGHLASKQLSNSQSFTDSMSAGVIWQWQLRLTSSYRDVIVRGEHLRLTNSLSEPPCCLPGLEKMIQDPHNTKCLSTSLGQSQNLCQQAGGGETVAVLGQLSMTWLNLGHGTCAAQDKTQPAHYDCGGVTSFTECTALCEYAGMCSGINFQKGPGKCILYLVPGASHELPPNVSGCQQGSGGQTKAIVGVNYGPVGTPTFKENSCYALLNCSKILNKTGEWVQLASSEGTGATSQLVEYQFGTQQGEATTHSKEFSHSAHNSFSLGFGVGAFGISLSASDTAASHTVKLHRDAFFKTSTTTYTDTFSAGIVWQFQFKATTPCGNTTIQGNHLLVTNSTSQPPCCLPGMQKDLTNPHGECRAAADGTVIDLCNRPN